MRDPVEPASIMSAHCTAAAPGRAAQCTVFAGSGSISNVSAAAGCAGSALGAGAGAVAETGAAGATSSKSKSLGGSWPWGTHMSL